jgi:hypothetical protein
MTIFTLSGTAAQQALVSSALAACDFPFERLVDKLQAQTGRTTIPVEWADLSRYAATVSEAAAKGGHAHVHEDGDTAHPIEYRQRVLGLAWYSGKVSMDVSLEANPDLAREVFLSEGAHMVDFFYMTDEERGALIKHWDPTDDPNVDWFDAGPYETWMGEAFMGLFVRAFAPSVPVTLTQFTHEVTGELVQSTRRLLLREPQPPAPDADPLAGFPYDQLDAWADKRRPWWARYAKTAADAYLAWR